MYDTSTSIAYVFEVYTLMYILSCLQWTTHTSFLYVCTSMDFHVHLSLHFCSFVLLGVCLWMHFLMWVICLFLYECSSMLFHTAQKASWTRGFYPGTLLVLDSYHLLKTDVQSRFVPLTHGPGSICAYFQWTGSTPAGFKKLFVRLYRRYWFSVLSGDTWMSHLETFNELSRNTCVNLERNSSLKTLVAEDHELNELSQYHELDWVIWRPKNL